MAVSAIQTAETGHLNAETGFSNFEASKIALQQAARRGAWRGMAAQRCPVCQRTFADLSNHTLWTKRMW